VKLIEILFPSEAWPTVSGPLTVKDPSLIIPLEKSTKNVPVEVASAVV
jgi:hypothetical protein